MKEFIKAYGNLSRLSAYLLLLGVKLSLSVLVVGIVAYIYNELLIGGYGNRELSIQIVQAAWNMFVIFILGGIIIDCVEKNK